MSMVEFYDPATGEREGAAAVNIIELGVLSTGTVVAEFKSEFAKLCGRDDAVAVSSGSMALVCARSEHRL